MILLSCSKDVAAVDTHHTVMCRCNLKGFSFESVSEGHKCASCMDMHWSIHKYINHKLVDSQLKVEAAMHSTHCTVRVCVESNLVQMNSS